MSKRYKVVTIAVSGKGNKVYRSGDIVTANLLNYPAEEMVKGGYLIPLDGEEKEVEKPVEQTSQEDATPVAESIEEKTVLFSVELDGVEKEVSSAKDLTKKQIIKLLTDLDVPFDRTKKEDVLFGLLLEAKTK